ncbi:MAG: YciI family protein [Actinomycetota bacterium]|nr:YciI family protein [Actinomycetota bacterium]
MKYLMLSYGTQADWDIDRQFGPADGIVAELMASGEFVYAAGLTDPTHLQTVEVRAGRPVVTDGPHAEEVLASFGIVDVASHDRALEIAAKMSGVFGRIEVRPIQGDSDAVDL